MTLPALRPLLAAAALTAALLVPAASARAQDSADKVRVGAKVLPEAGVAAGGKGRIEVTLEIEATWHLYAPGDASETTVSVGTGAEGLEVGAFLPTRPPKMHKGEYDDEPRGEFDGTVTYAADVTVPAGTAPGERILEGVADVSACDPNVCLAPGKAPWKAKLVVLAAAPAADPDAVAKYVKVLPATADGGRKLAVTLEIADGWHVYGPGDSFKQDTVIRITRTSEGVAVGEFRPEGEPHAVEEEGAPGPRKEFEGKVTYSADLNAAVVLGDGAHEIEGEVILNACNAEGCLPTGKVPFRLLVPFTPKRNLKLTSPPPAAPPALASAEDEGITPAFLLAAVIAGLLTIATPCVFPMIPLTVSLLTKRAEKEPGRIVPNALAYGAGMFVSLAGIGLAMSLVFGVAPTDLALSPGFNLVIFGFLLYLAFSLFGAYDIQLPAFMTNWAQGRAGTGGGAGLFFMGVVLAFTSFACAAPFAGALVVEARTSMVKGAVGMSVYAGTFSVPFVVTALFPGLLRKLPRSGGWLNAVKVVMGFVEVGAAFKFLRAADQLWAWGVFSFELVLAIWIACAIGSFLYLLGFIVLPHDTKLEGIGVGRLLWALAFLAAGIFLVPGLFGRSLPPFVESFIIRDAETESASAGKGESGPRWILNDLDEGLRQAKAAGKPVFVDFTGFG